MIDQQYGYRLEWDWDYVPSLNQYQYRQDLRPVYKGYTGSVAQAEATKDCMSLITTLLCSLFKWIFC